MTLPFPRNRFYGFKSDDVHRLYEEYLRLDNENELLRQKLSKFESLEKSNHTISNSHPTTNTVTSNKDSSIDPMLAAMAGYMVANTMNSSSANTRESTDNFNDSSRNYHSYHSGDVDSSDSSDSGGGVD